MKKIWWWMPGVLVITFWSGVFYDEKVRRPDINCTDQIKEVEYYCNEHIKKLEVVCAKLVEDCLDIKRLGEENPDPIIWPPPYYG